VAVIQIPLVYFSVNLFRSLHQGQSIRPDGATMPTEMLVAMLVNVVTFTVIYISLLVARMSVMKLEEEAAPAPTAAGAAVQPPRLPEALDG
jgi:heme exporter protein C